MGYNINIISNLFSRVAKIIASFAISVLITRAVGVEGNGLISYIIMIVTFLGSYCHLGINDSIAYFMRKNNYKEEDVVNNNLTIIGFLCISLGLLVFGLYKYEFLLVDYNVYDIIVAIILFISILLNNFCNAYYSVNNRFIEFNKITINMTLIKFVAIVIMYMTNTLNITTYLIIYTFDIAIGTVVCFMKSTIKFRIHFDYKMMTSQLAYGFPKFLAGLVMFLNYRVDQFMIKFFIGGFGLGLYSLSVNLAELVFLIPSSIEWVLQSFLLNNKDDDGIDKTVVTLKGTFYICTLISIIGLICSPLIPIIYGKGFEGAIPSFVILLIGVIFASVGKLGATYYFAKGDTKTQFKLTTLMLIVNLIGNVCLLPIIGINGAAIASTLSYIVYGMGYVILLKKREKIKVRSIFLINKGDVIAFKELIKKR